MIHKTLLVSAFVSLAFALTACPPAVTTGTLEIAITGNPAGTTPSITVSGPNSFSQTINATTTIPNLEPGSYTLSAAPVISSNLEYAGAITGSPASVTAGANTTASVTYAKSAVLISSLADAGAGSLRDTISSVSAGETIKFMAGTTGVITLASELEISKNVTLEGTGVTLSGNNVGRVLNVNAGANVTVKGLILTAGKTSVALKTRATRAALAGQGGIIYNAGTLTLKDVEVSGGEAVLGGGVYNAGTLTLESGSIKNNKAISLTLGAGRGGGVYNAQGATLTLSGGNVLGNTTDYHGGGIFNDTGATLTIAGGSIENNVATGVNGIDAKSHGGGVFNNGIVTMSNGLIKGNSAIEVGGGISLDQGSSFTLTGGTIEGNSLTYATTGTGGGGGVGVYKATFKMQGGTIKGNTAGFGAGVDNFFDSIFEMSGGVIENNTSPNTGGGVGNYQNSTFTMTNGLIQNNTAKIAGAGVGVGAGGSTTQPATFNFEGGTIQNNTTLGNGGGIKVWCSTVNIKGGLISTNTAKNAGGVQMDGCTPKAFLNISGGIIEKNTANDSGGGVNAGTDTEIKFSAGTLQNNTAQYGAGIHLYQNTLTITGGTIQKNISKYGGGVHASQSTITMTGDTVSSNTASENGGGFNNNDGTIFKLENGSITGNSAKGSGGVTNWKSTFNMTGGSITLNTSTQCGAGVGTNGEVGFLGIFNLSGGLIQNNTTTHTNGGGICKFTNGVLNQTGGTVSSNAPNDIFLAP